jgi:GT2 family glycosyltransferase
MPADVLVVTVNYHTETDVQALVRSLERQSAPWRLVVADNGSDAEGASLIADLAGRHDNVRIWGTGRNLGYFGAAAAVIRDIGEQRLPDWVVVSNPDITLAEDFVERLTRVDADVVAPCVLDAASGADVNPFLESRPGRFRTWSRQVIFARRPIAALWVLASILRSRTATAPTARAPGRARDVYAGHGALLAFRRSYFDRGGSLRHEPFLFGEELTVAENVRRTGGRLVYAPDVRAAHVGHVATGRWPSRQILSYQRDATRYVHRLLSQQLP